MKNKISKEIVEKIKGCNVLYLLQAMEGAFAMFEDNEGQEYIPFWFNEHDVKEYISDEWNNYTSEKMYIKEFTGWLDELEHDQIKLALMGDMSTNIISISPIELKELLFDK